VNPKELSPFSEKNHFLRNNDFKKVYPIASVMPVIPKTSLISLNFAFSDEQNITNYPTW